MPHKKQNIVTSNSGSSPCSAHILVGPTAVGKTEVAHLLAERMGARIVSADSMLVYRGMNIGTAKPSNEELKHFDYAGVDIVSAEQDFNLMLYLEDVRSAINARAVGPLMVVGGTGLYVKALIRGLEDAGGPDPELRAQAEKLLAGDGLDALRTFVKQKAPENYERLKDKDNPRRLVRALEGRNGVAATWGLRPSPRLVGLRVDRERLAARIAQRVDRMYADGLLAEVEGLLAGGKLSRTARQAIGYKEAIDVLAGKTTWEQARVAICTRTRRLAKSQMTWFRNQEQVDWIDREDFDSVEAVANRVEELWREHGRTQLRFQ